MRRAAAGLFLGLMIFSCVLAAVEPVVIPLVTDPPPGIDADLSEWTGRDRGVLLELSRPEQVTYGKGAWHNPRDLSGWVRVGHDNKYLYLVCHVVDSEVTQTQSGNDIWRGDHVIVLLDFLGTGKKNDIIQFGLSPGALTADGIKPELVFWQPEGLSPEGGIVAARSTSDGYEIEAAIPWQTLRIKPIRYQTFALDVAFSDADTPGKQETCISVSTKNWNVRNPNRLLAAGLADRNGFMPADAFEEKRVEIAENFIIEPHAKTDFNLEVGKIPADMVPTLTFKARAVWPKVGGCISGLYIDINDKPVPIKGLVERPRAMEFVGGGSSPSWTSGIALFYSKDFTSVEKSSYKPIGFKAHEYTLRLDGMIKEGANKITFKNNLHFSWKAKRIQIAVADAAFLWRPPSRFRPPKVWKPAPTGPLTIIEPETTHKTDYSASLMPGGAVRVSWQNRNVTFDSRFSRPGGRWSSLNDAKATDWDEISSGKNEFKAKSGDLTLSRSFSALAECLLVRDILVNQSEAPLPVMIEHSGAISAVENLYVSGRPIQRKTGANNVAANPSVVVLGKDSGIGIMAYDDIFRIHCLTAYDGKRASLRDRNLVLRPGVRYEHTWVIAPLAKPSYWTFINAMRRHFKTNFTLPGSFAFFPAPYTKYMKRPLADIGKFIDCKAADLVTITTGNNYKGIFAHGPVKRTCEEKIHLPTIKMLKSLRPQAKILVYFNCFDCARAKDDPLRWPECQVLRPDGKNLREGTSYPVYFPTLDNAYGKEMDLSVDWTINTLSADGVWWDMYNGYGMHYGEPWDGWSGDIDSRTHKLLQKKSSTALLSWPWRKKTLERFFREGKTVIINGGLRLTSEYAYQIPRAAETASIGNLSWMHLSTPIALGDHSTETNEAYAYMHMLKALDWGGLYYWYSSSVIPTRSTLTSFMFPFTPIELHEGYLIGKERILTNRSGLFGWGDTSDFTAHVFDRVGRETDKVKINRVLKNGKAYAEIRLAEGYSAAIIRK